MREGKGAQCLHRNKAAWDLLKIHRSEYKESYCNNHTSTLLMLLVEAWFGSQVVRLMLRATQGRSKVFCE